MSLSPVAKSRPSPQNPAQGGEDFYTVKAKDSLSKIAKEKGVSIEEILKANSDTLNDPNKIKVGMKLKIPSPKKPASAPVKQEPQPALQANDEYIEYKVKKGDSLDKIAKNNSIDWRTLAAFNQLTKDSSLQVGQVLRIPKPTPPAFLFSCYVLKEKDTEESIAKETSRDWKQIAKLNHIEKLASLPTGQVLLLPPRHWNEDMKNLFVPTDYQFQLKRDEKGKPSYLLNNKPLDLGKSWGKGISYLGSEKAINYFQNKTLSDDEKAIAAVSLTEGCFDSVGTWGGPALTSGMFQWSATHDDLGKLLLKTKELNQDDFQKIFGRFGLQVNEEGTLMYLGEVIAGIDTEVLRNEWFVYVFSQAGRNNTFQKAQVELAKERLTEVLQYEAAGGTLKSYLESSIGKALVLDTHVLRPNAVRACMNPALLKTNTDTFSKFLAKNRPKEKFTDEQMRLAIFCVEAERNKDIGKDMKVRIPKVLDYYKNEGKVLESLITDYENSLKVG